MKAKKPKEAAANVLHILEYFLIFPIENLLNYSIMELSHQGPAKMGKRYKSVSEMVEDLSTDETHRAFEDRARRQGLATSLFVLRNKRGLTQKEMAEKLGRTQGWVSKLERADIGDIKVGDVAAYVGVLGYQLTLHLHRPRNAVECVKFHAFEIKRHLDYLAKLAGEDEKIFTGVRDFFVEYLFNTLRLFTESASRLPDPVQLVEATNSFFEEYLEKAVPLLAQSAEPAEAEVVGIPEFEICPPPLLVEKEESQEDRTPA